MMIQSKMYDKISLLAGRKLLKAMSASMRLATQEECVVCGGNVDGKLSF